MSSHCCNLLGAIELKAGVAQEQLQTALEAILKNEAIDELPTIDPATQTIQVDFEYWGQGGTGDPFAEEVCTAINPLAKGVQWLMLVDSDSGDSTSVRVPYFLGSDEEKRIGQVLYGIEQMREWAEPVLGKEMCETVKDVLLRRAAFKTATDVPVKCWDLHGDDGSAPTHLFTIDDRRRSSSQVFLDITKLDGGYDDTFSISMEINANPLNTEEKLPCAHVHFNDDELAVSLFKLGDRILVRPETGVEVTGESRMVGGFPEQISWIVPNPV